jgi:hypothetical protein
MPTFTIGRAVTASIELVRSALLAMRDTSGAVAPS